MAVTPLKVAAVVLVLVTCRGSWAEVPTATAPKSSAAGERVRKDGVAAPMRLMKSSEEEESVRISSAPMRVPEIWGVKVRVRSQVAPGTMAVQAAVAVKSGSVWRERMWRVVVPVLESVTVWGMEALPTEVAAKVREFCEAL